MLVLGMLRWFVLGYVRFGWIRFWRVVLGCVRLFQVRLDWVVLG